MTICITISPKNKKGLTVKHSKSLNLLVGTEGFEPSTPCTPCKCATRLRYAPTALIREALILGYFKLKSKLFWTKPLLRIKFNLKVTTSI